MLKLICYIVHTAIKLIKRYKRIFLQITSTNAHTTNTMKNDDVIINLKLLKICGFYQMFDPTSAKIYNWNVYRLSFIVLFFMNQLIVFFGNVGFFVKMEDNYSQFDYFFYAHTCIEVYVSLCKVWILYYNADEIWELFNLTKLDFLRNEFNKKNMNILRESRDRNIKITYLYLIGTLMVVIPWQIFPFATYMFTTVNDNLRFQNILNLRFPVTISTYNQYFFIFYIMEWLIFVSTVFVMIITEVFFITFCCAIIGQYELIEETTKNIGHENGLQTGRIRLILI